MEHTANTTDAIAILMVEAFRIRINTLSTRHCRHFKIEFAATYDCAKSSNNTKPLNNIIVRIYGKSQFKLFVTCH